MLQERRYKQFKSAKNSIVKLLDDLDQNPNSSFERDIVCEEEDSFLLSTENMKALQILKDEVSITFTLSRLLECDPK